MHLYSKLITHSTPKFIYKFSTKLNISHSIGKPFNDQLTMSTGQLLLSITEKQPEKIALNSYSQNVSFTYEQLTNRALKLANSLLKDFKIQPKDRIGIYAYNKWEWYVVQLACSFVDAILVNINPSYRSEELAYTLKKVRVKVLFLSDQFKNSNYINIVQQIVPEVDNKQVHLFKLSSKKFPFLDAIVRMNNAEDKKHINGFVNFSDLFQYSASTDNLHKSWPSCHDPANIQFTSGTTGSPKAATLSHYNILNNGYAIGKRLRYTNNDNIVVPVPLYHCFGMILANLAALTRGATLTYVCQGFDPQKTLQAITKYKCTSLYGVPTMFSQYLRVYQQNPSRYDISKLRTGIIAGALAPEKTMQKILDILKLKDLTNCYGMTETSPVSFQTSPTDSFKQKTTTVGTVLEGLQAKIINPQTLQVCKINESGQFIAKGWAVMSGYWEDPAANQKVKIDDEWLRSGDLGVIDQEGYLTIVGRIKDMIIRGGQNVYPKQIQEYLYKNLQGAVDVQVVAVSDQKYGEQIFALIKVQNLKNNSITKEDIYKLCKGHIAHYKIPKFVKFVEQLPLTVTGKPQKYLMREGIEQQKRQKGLDHYAIR